MQRSLHTHLFLLVFSTILISCGRSGTDPVHGPDVVSAIPATTIQHPEGSLALVTGLENSLIRPGSTDPVRVLLKITAKKDTTNRERLPLNIALVLDRSGSMQGAKLEYAKQACELLIDNLDDNDRLSIVVYDSQVHVLRRGDKGTVDKEATKRLIRSITAGSMTNLSGGMLQGYTEVARDRPEGYVHRVLLMSDGLANVGITGMEELASIVRTKAREEGIGLSSFGVGADFNEDMMTGLAEHGRGNYWFIDQPDRIPGIFQQEMNGLLAVVAQNTALTFAYPMDRFIVEQVFGAESSANSGLLSFRMNDLHSGETRSVVVVLHPRNPLTAPVEFLASLEYDDVLSCKEHVLQNSELVLGTSMDEEAIASARDEEVTRRYVQFKANWNMQQALHEADQGNYRIAQEMVKANRSYLIHEFGKIAPDSAQNLMFELNEDYEDQLNDLDVRSPEEIKMIQKENKSQAYKNRKGK